MHCKMETPADDEEVALMELEEVVGLELDDDEV